MEIELKLDGKKKKFKSKGITFRTYRVGTELLPKIHNGEFLGDNFPMEELDEAVDVVLNYFNRQFTQDEFYDGFEMEDSLDFITLFHEVLLNIQMDNGKRELLANAEGKSKTQKQA